MNLTKLFETQKVLDERIVKEKGLEGQQLFSKKILALLTELGELSNEWQGFKFWKEDNEPRTDEFILKKEFQHLHITRTGAYEFQLRDEFGKVVFDDVTDNHHDRRNLVLEEYVDCLHFILSIGLELDFKHFQMIGSYQKPEETTKMFIEVFEGVIKLKRSIEHNTYKFISIPYSELFESFIALGEMLGFTWEQIEAAYFEKNEINHERQNNGY